ncbi:FGGY-family carbohydrate kinase [Candidatus Bathyarchaeota archaeon]|nr:FGGY-family carbohydrate kinase [Candidatus Bathyarchaeota archaeon]
MGDLLLLGVDIGTSGSKGVLIDTGGTVLAEGYTEHDVSRPKPGWAEHDPEKIWWGDFVKITKSVLRKSRVDSADIGGICVSGLCPDVAAVDRKGRPIRPGILYADVRPVEEIAAGKETIGDDRSLDVTGNVISTQATWPKMLWVKKNEPGNWDRTFKFLSGHSYVVMRLTGEYSQDYTVASMSGIFDSRHLKWDEDLVDLAEISLDKLPPLYPAHGVVGEITGDAAGKTGLAEGTPVVAGCCDAVASMLSAGVTETGESVFFYGTTGVLVICTDELKPHPSLMNAVNAIPGKYILVGAAMATSGAIIKWFRDEFAPLEKAAESKGGINAYRALDNLASKIPPGSEGVIMLPYFAGERTPIFDPLARGVIFGLLLNHTRAHIYRAALEAVAYGLYHHIEILRGVEAVPDKIFAVDGGARSRLWRQIVSDVINIPQHYIAEIPGAPFGGAYLAGYGTGVFHDFKVLRGWRKIKETTEPRPEVHRTYMKFYSIYRQLYDRIKDLYVEDAKALGIV